MRIQKDSEHHEFCSEDCRRYYCRDHRLIYNECITGNVETEGDYDVPNGTHQILMVTAECPECIRQYNIERAKAVWQRSQESTNADHRAIA